MTTQVMTFPHEFERNFFRDLDREYATILLLNFIVFAIFSAIMMGQEVKEMTAEEVARFAQSLYQVKVTRPVEVAKAAGKAAEEVAAPKEEAAPVEEARPVTEVDKAAAVAAAKASRAARQEASRAALANRIAILAGPTAKGGRARGARASAGTVGLTESGGITDMKEMIGMVGDVGMAGKVSKARGGGAIGGDIGTISLDALRAMSAGDLELMLNQAPVQLNRSTITAKGKGTKAAQRSQTAISGVVLQNKNQVQYCYWTYKRRDSGLKGRVVVEFTIAPTGEVLKVRFRESNWGGSRLGGEVERCIESILMQWHFDPIPESEGNVTAGATYIFE